jgi:hypothetical protein
MYMMKTSAEGDSLWALNWGDQNWEYAFDIKPTFDGGYVVLGRHYSITTGDNNIVLLKYGPYPTIYNTLRYHRGRDLPIEDNQTTMDTMYFELPSNSTVIGAMVYIDTVMHGEIRDLVFTLTHNGITDTLIDRPGAGGANILNSVLHGAGSCPVQAGIAPFTGVYKPYQVPAIFTGTDANGEWELAIHDTETGNTGTLVSWGLKVFYETMVGIEKLAGSNIDFELFPNPCSITTKLRVTCNASRVTSIDLYSISGTWIKRIMKEYKLAGEYETEIDVSDLPSGVYIVKMQSGNQIGVKKLIVR